MSAAPALVRGSKEMSRGDQTLRVLRLLRGEGKP